MVFRKPPVKYLGLSASKFVEEGTSIKKFFETVLEDQKNQKNDTREVKPDNPTTNCHKNSNNSDCEELKKEEEIPSTSKNMNSTTSFFVRFLNERKLLTEKTTEKKSNDDDDDDDQWVSLTEIIPDLNEADENVINMLPSPLRKKFNDRIIKSRDENNKETSVRQTNVEEFKKDSGTTNEFCATEKCNECGENVPLYEFLEHLDYHVAVKINTEINGRDMDNEPMNKIRKMEKDINAKRKKSGIDKKSKKMKSITSFFTVAPKQN